MQTESQLRLGLAVKRLRALRALPRTDGTERAQKKVLDKLNLNEIAEVAMRLAELEDSDKKTVTTVAPASQKEVSHA